jgi:hypothetical protein
VSGFSAKLAVLAVFAVGCFCGGATVSLYRLHVERQILASREPGIQLIILALDRDLRLSEAQRNQIHQILVESRQEILTAHPELVPEMLGQFERTQDRIGGVLTPEQRVRYDRLVEERRKVLEQLKESAPAP